tara:strand:- start:1724 stop:2350 length:627 start_codon:yes stop_codon:yes gene_type:complete
MGKISGYQSTLRKLKKTLTSIVFAPWCQVCGENKVWKLVLHHHAYFSDSTRHYNYKTKTEIGELQYHSSLALEVEQRPENFGVLCNSCHNKVEVLLDMGEERAEHTINVELFRLRKLILETGYKKYETELAEYRRIVYEYHESLKARKRIKDGKHKGLDSFKPIIKSAKKKTLARPLGHSVSDNIIPKEKSVDKLIPVEEEPNGFFWS